MFIHNQPLYLPADLKIRIEINSPAFETDSLPASIIYYFDLPITPNEAIFNYANYTEIKNKFREYPWKMRYEGFWLFSGKLVVTNINNTFRCAATIKQLPIDFSDKNITDFPYDNIQITSTMSSFINTVRADSDILAFPKIYAPNLYQENNPSWEGIINPDTPVENTNGNFHTVIPLFKTIYLLKSIFQSAGYQIDHTRIDNTISKLLIFNNYTLDSLPSDYYVFCNITDNALILPLLQPQVDKYHCINLSRHYVVKEPGDYSITAYIKGTIGVEKTTNLNIKVILVKITDTTTEEIELSSLIDEIHPETSGLICDFSKTISLDKSIREFDIILRARHPILFQFYTVYPKSGYIEIFRLGAVEGQTDKNAYMNVITPKNHFPAISVNDFLLALKQSFGLAYFIDNINPNIQLCMLSDLLHTRYLDLTNFFIENSTEITITEPTTYLLKYNIEEIKTEGYDNRGTFDSFDFVDAPTRPKLLIQIRQTNSFYISEMIDNQLVWSRLGDSFKPLQTASYTKKEEIELKIIPMSMECRENTVYPFYEDQGISSMFSPDASPIEKLIFLIQISGTGASNSGLSWQGDELGISLDLHANNGIYNRYLKEWYTFLSTANEYTCNLRVDIETMLKILELFKPQPKTPREQIRRIRIKNQNYIPKQFTFELTHTGITCQAKLMKNDGYKSN